MGSETYGNELQDRDKRFAGLGKGGRSSAGALSRSERREHVQKLKAYSLFARCDAEDLDAVVQIARPFSFPSGWAMVRESTPADACFVIDAGNAQVIRDGERIAELGAGDVVGEMAVLTGSLRRATVTSTTRITGLRVENEAFTALLEQRPRLLEALRGEFRARTAAPRVQHRPRPALATD
jgi:CRP-like cAMP-binding protein